MWIGGIMGVIFLTGNVIIFPKLGVVETIVIPILVQVVMALASDHFALFGCGQGIGEALACSGCDDGHELGNAGRGQRLFGAQFWVVPSKLDL